MKKLYLMVGQPGMGKTTLTNKLKIPVIHFDDKTKMKTGSHMREYAEERIRNNKTPCVLDYTNATFDALLDSLYRYRDYDITLVVMYISKERWKNNLIKRNKKFDIDVLLKDIDDWYEKFEQIKKYISITKYRKIYITDNIMEKVVNGTLIPNFEEM